MAKGKRPYYRCSFTRKNGAEFTSAAFERFDVALEWAKVVKRNNVNVASFVITEVVL